MDTSFFSSTTRAVLASFGDFPRFAFESRWAERRFEPGVCDFVVGNPHEPVVEGFPEALVRWSEPRDKDWFAYKLSEPAACEIVAASLRDQLGVDFDPADVAMTNGAFAGLTVAMRTVVDPGDEVIFLSPPWFFHEATILGVGATPVRVLVHPETGDPDLDAIAAAITPRTRGVIVNSPNNPTGRIYAADLLRGLADLLTEASARHGRPIWIFSDEAYRRIVFDGRDCPSPTQFYPRSFLVYTYGKTLLTPGQRIGYLAMPPTLPEREALRLGLLSSQVTTGYAFPNALLQLALGDLDKLSIDIPHLQRKRDRMVAGLRAAGYDVRNPEGTFYILGRSPLADDMAFFDRLAAHDVYVLPGSLFELPGYFRISLTATMEMIERALPIFARVMRGIERDGGSGGR